jgi:hypothetical protein
LVRTFDKNFVDFTSHRVTCLSLLRNNFESLFQTLLTLFTNCFAFAFYINPFVLSCICYLGFFAKLFDEWSPGCFGPETNIFSIIYFCFLHSQGGRLYNDNAIGQVLCVELWLPNGFTPYVLIANRMLHMSLSNHIMWLLMLPHCAASAGA